MRPRAGQRLGEVCGGMRRPKDYLFVHVFKQNTVPHYQSPLL